MCIRDRPEGAPHTRRALDASLAAHLFGEPPRDGQPQPGTAILARSRIVGLFEGAEQPGQCLGRNTDTGILHRETYKYGLCILLLQAEMQSHVTGFGELDRVGGIVEQSLLQARLIALQIGRESHGFDSQDQAFGPDAFGQYGRETVSYTHLDVYKRQSLHNARMAVATWEARLHPLAQSVPESAPSVQVWKRIESHINGARAQRTAARAWRLNWLRPLGGVLSGIIMGVLIVKMAPSAFFPIEAQQEKALSQSYVGLLLDQTGIPSVLASTTRHGKRLKLKILKPVSYTHLDVYKRQLM